MFSNIFCHLCINFDLKNVLYMFDSLLRLVHISQKFKESLVNKQLRQFVIKCFHFLPGGSRKPEILLVLLSLR